MKKICYICTISDTIKAFFIPQLQFLAKNGFDVTVVCSEDETLVTLLGKEIHYKCIEIPRGVAFIKMAKSLYQLIIFFKKNNFDFIQYSTPNAAFCSAIAAKLVGCKIRNYHCMGFRYLGFEGMKKKFFKLLERITCSLSSYVECVSNSNMELGISEKLFKKEKVTVVFNGSSGGVDLHRFNYLYRELWRNEIRSILNIDNKEFVFGFVGRITKDKGVEELINSFESLGIPSKLLIVGNLEKDHNIDKYVLNSAYKNSDIIFVGSVNNIEKYYASMDVLVLPSYREGFGNVIIESEAMGTPVIVSNIPGPKDAMLNGITGMLVEPKDVDELRSSMEHLYKTYFNYDYGLQCVNYVKKNFDNEILCKEILKRKKKLLRDMS